jgi:CPA2 family monovalent cation:H+ antiporter-2
MAGQQSLGHVAVKLSVSVLLAVGLVALFYVLFTYIVPRFFQQRTWQLNRDLPILLAMVLALGCAWLANQVRLSPALGAFAGGVLLAASPFATQIRADVRPLNTVLVTLFFAAIGMFGDPVWLIKNWALVGGIVLLIVVGKPLVVALLARIFGAPWRYAIATGLCLAQIGEFSFVLATIAQRETDGVAIMSATTFRALVSATIISLLLTPYMVGSATRIGAWWDRLIRRAFSGSASADQTSVVVETAEGMAKRDILIIGFGPAGQRVAEGLMTDYQNRMVVIDLNRDNVDVAQRYGLEGVLGDASQTEILEHAGIYEAEVVVLTLPDHRIMRQLIYHVRDLAPGARIVARCRYHVRHWELLTAGADHVADEEDEVGRVMASQVGDLLGHVPSEA